MRRYQLVLGGTVAGIAGVLAFPTHGSHLRIPLAGASNTTATTNDHSGTGNVAPTTTTPGSGAASPSTSSPASATRSATSADEPFRYGDLAVTVTVDGNKITNVAMATMNETDGKSVQIDNYAVPQLEKQVISANSVNIDGVSGATFTSQAFVDAVSNALQKLGFK